LSQILVRVWFLTTDGYLVLRIKTVAWGFLILPFERRTSIETLNQTIREIVERIKKFLPDNISLIFHEIGRRGHEINFLCHLPVDSDVFQRANFYLVSKKEFSRFKSKIPREDRLLFSRILGLQTDLSSFLEGAT